MKSIITFISIAVLFNVNCWGQVPNWEWARHVTGNATSFEEGYGCTTDAFGNIYATGWYYGGLVFDSITLPNCTTGADIFVVKYSSTGNVLWAKGMGGNSSDGGNSVATDASGNVFVAGLFYSSSIIIGLDTLGNSGFNEMFIAKFDNMGNPLWAKCAGALGQAQTSYSVTTDILGNAFVTGNFISSPIIFGGTSLSNSGGNDVFITKYSSTGSIIWANSIGGTGDEFSTSITTDSSSNTYITGQFSSPTIIIGSDTLINAGGTDIFIVKYSPIGNVIWAKKAGGSGDDIGYSIATDLVGNIYLTGSYKNSPIIFGNYTLTNAGDEDMFITKYTTNGNVINAKKAGGFFIERGYSVALTPPDITGMQSIYLTGEFESPFIILDSDTLEYPTGPYVYDPMFIVKYDSALNVICASSLASGADDRNSVAVDYLGNAYISGDLDNNHIPFIIGTDTLTLTSTETFFLAKYNCNGTTTSVNDPKTKDVITISPNPFSSQTTITFSSDEQHSIKVVNVLGEVIQQLTNNNKQLTVDMTGYAKGIYFVRIEDEKKNVVNRKIVVQ